MLLLWATDKGDKLGGIRVLFFFLSLPPPDLLIMKEIQNNEGETCLLANILFIILGLHLPMVVKFNSSYTSVIDDHLPYPFLKLFHQCLLWFIFYQQQINESLME